MLFCKKFLAVFFLLLLALGPGPWRETIKNAIKNKKMLDVGRSLFACLALLFVCVCVCVLFFTPSPSIPSKMKPVPVQAPQVHVSNSRGCALKQPVAAPCSPALQGAGLAALLAGFWLFLSHQHQHQIGGGRGLLGCPSAWS
jgi:hypothetical protein